MDKNLRNQSRDIQWSFTGNSADINEINCGSLLRIADATEKMALRYTELIDKAARLEASNKFYSSAVQRRDRSIAALKGQITKLKRKLVPA